jgi:hypothetical protein
MASRQELNYRIDWRDPAEVSGKVQRAALQVLVDEAKDEVYQTTPQGATGHLRESVEGRLIEGGSQGLVSVKARHAHLIHDGVQAHEAYPTGSDSKAIRFWADGELKIRRRASHPGIRANPWVERAVDHVMTRLDPLMAQAGASIERQLG